MNRLELKEAIESKFGTISNFARMVGIEKKPLTDFLRRPELTKDEVLTKSREERIKEYREYLESVDNPDGIGCNITDMERLQIYIDVVEKCGSVQGFCTKYPQFKYDFVNNIVSQSLSEGYRRIKRKTTKYVELVNFLSTNNN